MVTVKRQPGSKQYGVYVDGKLAEGGFFSRVQAERCAEMIRDGRM